MALSLVNPPCRVIFAGFEADTRHLGVAGWKVSVEENFRGNFMEPVHRMLLHFTPSRLNLIAECDPFHTARWRQRGGMLDDLPVFVVQKAACDFRIIMQIGTQFSFQKWSDTAPAMVEADLYSTPLFLAKEAPKAEELIVEPQDVSAMLEQIKRMQSPEQAAIRKRRRQEEAPVAHATILSFAA